MLDVALNCSSPTTAKLLFGVFGFDLRISGPEAQDSRFMAPAMKVCLAAGLLPLFWGDCCSWNVSACSDVTCQHVAGTLQNSELLSTIT